MAISVKSKFAGFLRGLIGRADDRAPARAVTPTAAALTPAPAPAAPLAPPPALTRAACVTNPDEIELPLAPVVAGLPLDLRAKLMAAPPAGLTIRLSAELVIGQLAFGAVKISFGELRHLVPGVFVNSGGEFDNKLISLPLQEILPRLNPALLARRAAKKIEVTDEIVGPFAGRGRGFSFTTQPLKAPAAPAPAPAPVPEPAPQPPINFGVPPARQVSPAPMAAQFPPRLITPAAPSNGANGTGTGNGHVLPISPLSSRPTPTTGNGGNGNGNGGHGGNGNGRGLALPPGLRLGSVNGQNRAEMPSPMKMSAGPSPSPAASRPAPAQPMIFAALGDLCQNWPEELKNEIFQSPLATANVPLDGAVIMPGLKRGRVTMIWKQLRLLAQPGSSPSPNDNLELELPLKVIAPLFLAAQKSLARPQTKASVSAEIPDLFFGFPQPAAPVLPVVPVIPVLPVAPLASLPPPTPTTPVLPPLARPAQKAPDTNFYGRTEKNEALPLGAAALPRVEAPQTDFMSRMAHPKEVVERAAALAGVAGSVVAMQDGLRVASRVPGELNADTLAAFLPQIFERVSQSTRELRMGALNNVSFTVGNVPWKIFRVNAVYFAAFGNAGEQLPSAQLAQLAAELDRKKQQ